MAAPTSLDALFKNKAKKKPKSMNMNAAMEKPPPPAPRVLRPAAAPSEQEGWERVLRRDQELLRSCGLWMKEVEADGACLFRAFADQLDAEGAGAHAAYRERCVDFLKAHRADFEPFLSEDFDEYCENMRQPTAWGGQIEVQALARDLGVNAVIYQPTEAGRADALLSSCVEVLTASEDDAQCVQLSFHPQHHAGQHYNSVRCRDDEGEGMPPRTTLCEIKRRIEDALRPPAPEEKASSAEATAAPAKGRAAKVF
eukprot:TRINITY_DN46000_c0_g1_i1.p1 TRINITY_DN46000_c0_g1~~TRINITY_DN46000_c0_g1_i1.p1  ORF type:complete len:255 (+),score=66.54 TRINITY_DN46000_c0_g1_i1:104-868(+)